MNTLDQLNKSADGAEDWVFCSLVRAAIHFCTVLLIFKRYGDAFSVTEEVRGRVGQFVVGFVPEQDAPESYRFGSSRTWGERYFTGTHRKEKCHDR